MSDDLQDSDFEANLPNGLRQQIVERVFGELRRSPLVETANGYEVVLPGAPLLMGQTLSGVHHYGETPSPDKPIADTHAGHRHWAYGIDLTLSNGFTWSFSTVGQDPAGIKLSYGSLDELLADQYDRIDVSHAYPWHECIGKEIAEVVATRITVEGATWATPEQLLNGIAEAKHRMKTNSSVSNDPKSGGILRWLWHLADPQQPSRLEPDVKNLLIVVDELRMEFRDGNKIWVSHSLNGTGLDVRSHAKIRDVQ